MEVNFWILGIRSGRVDGKMNIMLSVESVGYEEISGESYRY